MSSLSSAGSSSPALGLLRLHAPSESCLTVMVTKETQPGSLRRVACRWHLLGGFEKAGVDLELLPMLLGFFTYKAGVISKQFVDLVGAAIRSQQGEESVTGGPPAFTRLNCSQRVKHFEYGCPSLTDSLSSLLGGVSVSSLNRKGEANVRPKNGRHSCCHWS